MNWIYGILIFLAGVASIPAGFATAELVEDALRDFKHRRWKRANYGKWLVHSHGNGSCYDNGGMFSIYREGFHLVNGKYNPEYHRWNPPMRTHKEATEECARLNALAKSA